MAAVAQRSGAQATVEVLERHGVSHVFGLCGHTIIAVLAALEGSAVRFVGVHHEQVASHAADGFARASGEPGVVLTHLGPGLTNSLTGVATAALDRTPLVAVTGNVQSYFFGRHAHMETAMHGDADQARSFAPFCKQIWRVDRPDRLVPALEAAFRTARSGVPGPVLVDVTMDVFSLPVPEQERSAVAPEPESPPGALPPALATRIADALMGAKRPLLYAGSGAATPGGSKALVALAESIGAPVAFSLMGKGSIPDCHPLCVGASGVWGTPAANAACREADVMLAVGTRFGELDCSSWQLGTTFSIPPTRLFHIDADPAEIGRTYAPEIGAVADPQLTLEAILGATCGRNGRTARLPPVLERARTEFDAEVAAVSASEAMPIHPGRVLADLRAALPASGRLVGDTGWNKNGLAQQWPVDATGEVIVPGGFATMGFGPAAAIGVALADPSRPVLALVGDGAFLTNPAVVLTAVEEQIPVVWAIMNNGAYATITGLQTSHYGTGYGTVFDAPLDYVGLARSFGARGLRIEHPAELTALAAEALAAGEPCVLDIPCTSDPVPVTGHWDINALFAADPTRAS